LYASLRVRRLHLCQSGAAASKREFDCLLFWSLDRLSREGTVETLNHLQRLTSYGVNYRSFTEQYLDSTGIFKEAVIGGTTTAY
jgi:DNA invertase Pin-like site-specific DNA recombinase